MIKRFKLGLFAVLLTCSLPMSAQDATLSVTVVNSEDDPIERAIVTLSQFGNTIVSDTTNINGRSTLSGFDSGTYSLYINYLDSSYQKQVDIKEGMNRVYFDIPDILLPTVVVSTTPIIEERCCGCYPREPDTFYSTRGDPFLNTMGGMYMMDGSIPTFGRLLNVQPYD